MNHTPHVTELAHLATRTATLAANGSPALIRARECVLDLIALAIGGTQTEVGRIAIRSKATSQFPARLGTPGCSIFGGIGHFTPGDAAGLNGLLAHALQCDDGMRRAHGHPGIAVIPAVFAAAEATNADGPTLLRAIVGGYEVFARLGAAINPEHLSQGFHPSGTVGAVAAAAGASLVFDAENTRWLENAMALAASASGGLMEHSLYGDMSSYFVGGNAARVGIEAAILAREGMTGPLSVLEGKYGMAAAMAGGTLRTSDLLGLDPGGPKILQTYTKLYPSCRHTHAAIEAALSLRAQILDPDEIESIRIGIYKLAIDECDRPSVHTLAGAESSLQLTVAAALIHGDISLRNRSYGRYQDKRVQLLSKRIDVVHEPAFDALLPGLRPADVRLTTVGQQTFQVRVDLPRGEPERPLTWDELADKAWSAASSVLGAQQFSELEGAVASLESALSLRHLAEAITTNTDLGDTEND
ncbi:MmgE/PrpD family protein [Arthrobacter sp. StoSoilB5]|uniref:MmgE/PrpD family protein n=1 Tax=Arthrobacter sp. StoSoilB5 TaxID=2830992 RepID=UPI001CC4CB48|nr:MmgE/PrpD family protein [Arthrobacter sp. StoSoilB5]BCW44696.1 hypothetical protein StoSoilB5_18800 [Arthrobacter sp. StoSoilB5]